MINLYQEINLREFISLAVVKTDVKIAIQTNIQYQIICFLLLNSQMIPKYVSLLSRQHFTVTEVLKWAIVSFGVF